MRHFYIRLVLGVIWLNVAVVSAVSGDLLFAALHLVLGIVFLYSAYSMWKKNNDNREE